MIYYTNHFKYYNKTNLFYVLLFNWYIDTFWARTNCTRVRSSKNVFLQKKLHAHRIHLKCRKCCSRVRWGHATGEDVVTVLTNTDTCARTTFQLHRELHLAPARLQKSTRGCATRRKRGQEMRRYNQANNICTRVSCAVEKLHLNRGSPVSSFSFFASTSVRVRENERGVSHSVFVFFFFYFSAKSTSFRCLERRL